MNEIPKTDKLYEMIKRMRKCNDTEELIAMSNAIHNIIEIELCARNIELSEAMMMHSLRMYGGYSPIRYFFHPTFLIKRLNAMNDVLSTPWNERPSNRYSALMFCDPEHRDALMTPIYKAEKLYLSSYYGEFRK